MALFNDPTNIDNEDDLQIEDKDYEAELVGEGKKFKTTKDLAKAKAQSDAFIEQLKNENKIARVAAEKLQDELKTRKTLQEFLDQMNTQRTAPPAPPKEPNNDGENKLTPESIQQLVEQTIASRSTAQREEENLNTVQSKLIEIYGRQYEATLRQRTKELGMTEQEMTAMAMRSPKAFLELVAPPSTQRQPSLFNNPTSRVNTEALRTNTGEKNWAYYEKIRKTDQRKYFEPAMHNEMMKQLELLGDDFYK